VARRHPGRPERPATHRATPTRLRRPSLPAATRPATRRRRHPYRMAMAAIAHCRSPQCHQGPILARVNRKVERPYPGRLRRHPPPAVGGRRWTAPRRSSRRSPLVAHPRSATADTTRNRQRCPSDPAHSRAGAHVAGEAASGVRPEPLTLPTQNDGGIFRQDPLPRLTLNIYQGTLCSALVFAALRAAPRPCRPTAIKRGPKWKRRADRPARHAVLKSATTKINYKKRETATFWDCHRRGLAYFRRGARLDRHDRSKTDTDRSA
jgi:hypothetical protein